MSEDGLRHYLTGISATPIPLIEKYAFRYTWLNKNVVEPSEIVPASKFTSSPFIGPAYSANNYFKGNWGGAFAMLSIHGIPISLIKEV